MGSNENIPHSVVIFDSSKGGVFSSLAVEAAENAGWVAQPFKIADYATLALVKLGNQTHRHALITTLGLGRWESVTGSTGYPLFRRSNNFPNIARGIISSGNADDETPRLGHDNANNKIPKLRRGDILIPSNDPELPEKLSKWLVGLVARVD